MAHCTTAVCFSLRTLVCTTFNGASLSSISFLAARNRAGSLGASVHRSTSLCRPSPPSASSPPSSSRRPSRSNHRARSFAAHSGTDSSSGASAAWWARAASCVAFSVSLNRRPGRLRPYTSSIVSISAPFASAACTTLSGKARLARAPERMATAFATSARHPASRTQATTSLERLLSPASSASTRRTTTKASVSQWSGGFASEGQPAHLSIQMSSERHTSISFTTRCTTGSMVADSNHTPVGNVNLIHKGEAISERAVEHALGTYAHQRCVVANVCVWHPSTTGPVTERHRHRQRSSGRGHLDPGWRAARVERTVQLVVCLHSVPPVPACLLACVVLLVALRVLAQLLLQAP
eukprot:7385880-Prymnesium_polylepis.1